MIEDTSYALGATAAYADATADAMRAAADRYEADGYRVLAAFLRDQLRAREAQEDADEARRCACVCGCGYRLDGYQWHEDVCGACFDLCD